MFNHRSDGALLLIKGCDFLIVITIILAVIFFALIILVHEFGHFITAKIFKVKVNEFAIGMGPAIFKKQGKETLYSIRAIPVGGFCAMEGEDEESDPESADSFNSKPCLARIVILAAGAFMNILLGFIICIIVVILSSGSSIRVPVVESTVEGTFADGVLQRGDRITKINGYRINSYSDYSFELSMVKGDSCDVTVKRGNNTEKFNIKLSEAHYNDGTPYRILGIILSSDEKNIVTVLRESIYESLYMGKMVFRSIRMLISGEVGVENLSGPVGVVSIMNESMSLGLNNFLFIVAFIAINIGIMNLLPFPALDGGRIIFVLFELIFRRNIPRDKEGIIHAVGLILLFGVMIFATWNDIVRIFFSG